MWGFITEPEPTVMQLRTFYRVVLQAVLLSSYIAFVEMGRNENLYVYIGRYDDAQASIMRAIRPDGLFEEKGDS